MKLNNLSQGENISSIVSTKAGKCISIEAILFDECVDGPAKLDQVGDVDHGEQETDANNSVVNCKNCNNLCSGNGIQDIPFLIPCILFLIPGIPYPILGIPFLILCRPFLITDYGIPNPFYTIPDPYFCPVLTKVSDWMIYLLLTVVLAPYLLSNLVF